MIKNYIIDTNVMIHDPNFMYNFQDNNIIIPIIAIEELDKLKKTEGLVGFQVRNAIREIAKIRQFGNLHQGVKLPDGGTLRIELNHMSFSDMPDGMDTAKNDNKILAITMNLQKEDKDISTILVTKDFNLAIKGEALGLIVEDYENDKMMKDELYKGYTYLSLSSERINEIYNNGLTLTKEDKEQIGEEIYPNEFLLITNTDSSEHTVLTKYDGEKVVGLKYSNHTAFDIVPINLEQKMAFELLMDPEINFVSVTGVAGSGKTILATAVALEKVISAGFYGKIIFVRPVVPAGNDIGFLPGTEEEKLRPWMGAFYDAVDNILNNTYKSTHKETTKDSKKDASKNNSNIKESVDSFIETYRNKGIIETKTFTYMRGRTMGNALVIIDEAQEITPNLAKLILTRAGEDAKFVFLGDPSDNQIDNVLVDAKSNGLVYAVEKMKPFKITGHVALKQVERSPLAILAEKYM